MTVKPIFRYCPSCDLYFDEELNSYELAEIEERYGSEGWEQEADQDCLNLQAKDLDR